MRAWFVSAGLCLALVFAAPAMAGEPVNLNQANAEKLTDLDGIGEVLAERIVEFRQANGGFDSVDQLSQVEGIGAKTVAALEDRVAVGD